MAAAVVGVLLSMSTVVVVVSAALVACVSLGVAVVEMAPVGIVAVDVEGPATVCPAQRAVEVAQLSVLVILPCS